MVDRIDILNSVLALCISMLISFSYDWSDKSDKYLLGIDICARSKKLGTRAKLIEWEVSLSGRAC